MDGFSLLQKQHVHAAMRMYASDTHIVDTMLTYLRMYTPEYIHTHTNTCTQTYQTHTYVCTMLRTAGDAGAGVTVRKGTFTAMVGVQSLSYASVFGVPPPASVPVMSNVLRLYYNQLPTKSMDVVIPLLAPACSATDRCTMLAFFSSTRDKDCAFGATLHGRAHVHHHHHVSSCFKISLFAFFCSRLHSCMACVTPVCLRMRGGCSLRQVALCSAAGGPIYV
jgi:hypothetical protein